MGKFEKGDVIRAKRDISSFFNKDGLYRIAKATGKSFVLTDNEQPEVGNAKHHTDLPWLTENFELVSLKIEAGKFYKTRDGRKVGPMRVDHFHDREYGWTVDHPFSSSIGKAWRSNGTFGTVIGVKHDADLVAEWNNEAVAEASNDNAQPKFKVGDRAECTLGCGKATVKFVRSDGRFLVDWDDGSIGTVFWADNDFNLVTPATPTTTTAIVALIENGQPKPSSTPHVHTSTGAAETEAKRLAGKHKGKKFGVFTLTNTHEEAAPVYDQKWQNLAALGLKIDAIKELRDLASLDLLSAKRAVDAFVEKAA
jgi:hypothetical protein